MTDIYLAQERGEEPKPEPELLGRYVAARAKNGELWHAIKEPGREQQLGSTKWFVSSRALCGVRGRDSWGGGGMILAGPTDNSEFGVAMVSFEPSARGDHTTCKTCSRIYRKGKGLA